MGRGVICSILYWLVALGKIVPFTLNLSGSTGRVLRFKLETRGSKPQCDFLIFVIDEIKHSFGDIRFYLFMELSFISDLE
jgi:hypothetical protein